jgi:hypothetical protein
MTYGNIPHPILNSKVKDWDYNEVCLRSLIRQECDEDIIEATWRLDGEYLASFQAWTENYILILIHNSMGAYLARFDRNPK